MNAIEHLKSALKEVGEKYADDFCAGWRQRSCGDSLELVSKTQSDNNDYRRRAKHPELVTTGMVGGWNARNEIFPDNQP